uniref:Uncharacterized protein n=1 Tax=Knipowitschia caucasica TaxID=637954 RepID=A0AAV2K594_KNICA
MKNSVVHQVCTGTSVGRKSTIPTAPSGYTLFLEKQGNGPNYPLLSGSSAFVPIQGDTGVKLDIHQEGKDAVPSPTEQNSNSNNTSSETRSPSGDKADDPEEGSSSQHENMDCPRSEYPTLPVTEAPTGLLRKAHRVSPPWHCSTVTEGTGSDSGDSYHGNSSMKLRSVGPRARLLSKSETRKRSQSRSQSPDSAGEMSSVSRHSRESNSPTASSPNRRVSGTSSASSRRAPTDLQI